MQLDHPPSLDSACPIPPTSPRAVAKGGMAGHGPGSDHPSVLPIFGGALLPHLGSGAHSLSSPVSAHGIPHHTSATVPFHISDSGGLGVALGTINLGPSIGNISHSRSSVCEDSGSDRGSSTTGGGGRAGLGKNLSMDQFNSGGHASGGGGQHTSGSLISFGNSTLRPAQVGRAVYLKGSKGPKMVKCGSESHHCTCSESSLPRSPNHRPSWT